MIPRLLHRLLRRTLPADFREEFGPSMESAFEEAREAARGRGAWPELRVWIREAVDVVGTGVRLRADARRYGAEFVARGVGRRWTGVRGERTLGVWDDVRYGVRSLLRRPSLTLFAAVTLALGIGSTTAIFSTIESVVLNPLPYDNSDRIVGLFRRMEGSDAFLTPSRDDIEAWERLDGAFEQYEPWSFRSMTLSGEGESREVQAVLTRPGMFELLDRQALLGRTFTDEEGTSGANVAMVSHDFWVGELGGTSDVVGRDLQLDGETWTIIGVVPPRSPVPGWSVLRPDIWRPYDWAEVPGGVPVTAVLRDGVSLEAVNERLAALEEGGRTSTGFALRVADQVGSGVRDYLKLLMGAVVLLLLVSCVNVSNLLLFRANGRRRETAVRAALGGGRGRLTRQTLIESVLLSILGGALGIAIAYAGQAVILELRPNRLQVLDGTSINGTVLGFASAVTLLTGVLFGLVPALQASRPGALAPLRSGLRSEGDVVGRRVRWLLVSSEVALSFALLLGSLAVLETLIERQRVDVGFRADEVAIMVAAVPRWRYETTEDRNALLDRIGERLATLPGVAHVAQASGAPPAAGVWFGRLQVEGGEVTEGTTVLHGPYVRPGYFEVIGQRIVAGRGFTADDVLSDEPVIILGESTARAVVPQGDVVGRRVRMDDGDDSWMTVVGVVADVPMTGLSATSAEYQFYAPLDGWEGDTFLVRTEAGGDPARLLPLMKEVVASVDAHVRVDRLGTGTDLLAETLESERFVTLLMGLFAVMALLLAAVGLYGVVSQVVGQRTREIGIRVALGARRIVIARMVLHSASTAVLVGVLVGAGLAFFLGRVLESRVVGLEANGPALYALAAAALSLTALLAAYAPARRASRVDPVEAMRVE